MIAAMKRIVIIGSGGAGKSTLACLLGEILGLDVIHLDALYWKPGWVGTPKDEWTNTVENLVESGSWIIDGNYSTTMDIRLAAADTIIFLDFSRTICLWQAIKRLLRYKGRTRPDVGPGCPDVVDHEFLRWIWRLWRFPIDSRPGILQKIEQIPGDKQVIILHNYREVRQFLEEMKGKIE